MGFKHPSARKYWAFHLIAVAWTALVALLLFKIGTGSTQIGAPTTESEAIVRTNERLLEMVQWTISTILLVGGGLIGLNWYQNDKRLQNELERLENRSDSLSKDIVRTESMIRGTSDYFIDRHLETQVALNEIRSEIRHSTLSFFGYSETFDEGATLLTMLEKMPLNRDTVLGYVEKFLERVERIEPNMIYQRWLDGRSLSQLADALGKAGRTDLKERVLVVHKRFQEAEQRENSGGSA